MYPEDEQEIDRQCYQYRIIKHLMNDKLFFAPWTEENPPRQVLDIACGKGYWAVDMGDKFPSARVTGIDLSEGMETEVPPNVYFESIDRYVTFRFPSAIPSLKHLSCLT